MSRKDLWLGAVIGAGVGLLIQPILTNIALVDYLRGFTGISAGTLRLGIFAFFLVLAPVALAVAAGVSRWVPVIYQIAKFAAVGTLNSFIDLGIFNLEIQLSGQSPETLSTPLFVAFISVSFLFATTNSYIWNKLWTFGDKEKSTSGKLAAFYGVTALAYGLNTGVATILKVTGPFFGIAPDVWVAVVTKLVGIVSGMSANFLAYKFVIFRSNSSYSRTTNPANYE